MSIWWKLLFFGMSVLTNAMILACGMCFYCSLVAVLFVIPFGLFLILVTESRSQAMPMTNCIPRMADNTKPTAYKQVIDWNMFTWASCFCFNGCEQVYCKFPLPLFPLGLQSAVSLVQPWSTEPYMALIHFCSSLWIWQKRVSWKHRV